MPSGARVVLRRTADALLAVVLAPECAACGRPLDTPTGSAVCADCWSSVRPCRPPLCRACGAPLPSWRTFSLSIERCAGCRRRATRITQGASAGEYAGSLRTILHAFKYDRRRSLAAPLGARMREAGAHVLDGAACVVPVPLHPWRRIARGFNQAGDLAGALGLPVVHALWRRRATARQTGLTAAARRRNVRDAFVPSLIVTERARRQYLTDRIVVLVDDVRTTGATLDACARVLEQAGVREVRSLTLAHAIVARRDTDTDAANRR